MLRVLGPGSSPEIARRLKSKDGTVALVAVPLSTSFVAPATHEAVAWLESRRERTGSTSRRDWKCVGRGCLDWTRLHE